MRLIGSLLLAGAVISLGVHVLGAPEALYGWLYHHLLGGLDVPEDPSDSTVAAVGYVSLIGGAVELLGGVALLAIDRLRPSK